MAEIKAHSDGIVARLDGVDDRSTAEALKGVRISVSDGETVRITSRRGSILIGVRVSSRQARGQVFVPMHYREAAANLLTNPALDPYAKIASFKVSAVRIERTA